MSHITIANHLSKQDKNLIIEISKKETINQLKKYGFTDTHIQKIQKNFKKTSSEEGDSTMNFSYISDDFDEIIIFFPRKNTMKNRSDFFRWLKKASTFIPDHDYLDGLESLTLSTYSFEKYLSKPKNITHTIVLPDNNMAFVDDKKQLLQSIMWARDLVNTPAQDADPQKIVEDILSKKWKHFDVEILDETILKNEWCNLILAVWKWSNISPKMIILKPKTPVSWPKIGLIWKWVTFDAWGIQIKPWKSMLDMKCDMAWAAGILGVARYLDTLDNLPADVTIWVGLTENMTGWSAFKPLDVYTAYNGKTVEIHHTDAEWRLVLADTMSYVEKNYKVQHIITMATLTGACLYALWNDIAGIMGDDEKMIQKLIDNWSFFEPVWRLPYNKKFKKSLESDIADIRNISQSEKADASVWWAFLSYFQGNAMLTHIDIAWPAYRETPHGYMVKWWTGWWVKKISEILMNI